MKLVAINGSPRKTWNTAILLSNALEGAATQGAETILIHLYDLNFKGCISCFGCKKIGGNSYGKCAVHDDLTPIFQAIEEADALLLGSPIYLGRVTGEMASFMERLVFPYLVYNSNPPTSLFPKKMLTGFIYTMNVPEEMVNTVGYDRYFATNVNLLSRIFGPSEFLTSCDTLQVDDYNKIRAFGDPLKKAQRRKDVFPDDCKKAFELGIRLVTTENTP